MSDFIVTLLAAVLLGVATSLISTLLGGEIEGWFASLLRRRVTAAARKLPHDLDGDYEEEWSNELSAIKRPLLAVRYVMGVNRAARVIASEQATTTGSEVDLSEVKRLKEAAIEAQEFEKAAFFRDVEHRLQRGESPTDDMLAHLGELQRPLTFPIRFQSRAKGKWATLQIKKREVGRAVKRRVKPRAYREAQLKHEAQRGR